MISTNLNRTTKQKNEKENKKEEKKQKKKQNKKQNKLNNQMSLIQYMFSSHKTFLLKALFCV